MERIVRVGALNIVAQPHSASIYKDLIVMVKNRRKAGRIRGDRYGMIALMGLPDDASRPDAYVQGVLGTFTQINSESDWINVTTGMKVEGDDLTTVKSLPKNLQPNRAENRFRFYLKDHILFFEVGNASHKLTPQNAEKLFQRLFSPATIKERFGEISVTAIPDQETIQRILSSKGLKALRIVVSAPNPDNGKEAERQFMERLEDIHVQRVDSMYVAKQRKSIDPDDDLKQEAIIASRNGRVDARIVVNNKVVPISTVDQPFIYPLNFNQKSMNEHDAFGLACDLARRQLKEKKQAKAKKATGTPPQKAAKKTTRKATKKTTNKRR